MHQWEVSKEESGTTLLAFLKKKLDSSYSARKLKKAIESNFSQVNNRTERFASTIVGTGDKVTFRAETISSSPSQAITFNAARVLYEDQDLFVYDKPPGIASDSPELKQALQRHCQSLILVHRLDRETSGVLIFAKSKLIFGKFVEIFKQLKIHKTYLAIVDGIPPRKNGLIDNFIGELHRYQGQIILGEVPPSRGLRAITRWECEKSGKEASLLRCFPKTGRTHQIRVHLSEMGHPILGDYQYGKRFTCMYRPVRCLLHALEVSFPHPTTGKTLKITASIPEDLNTAIETLL
jgi:RluA family pseudouridine synthase